MTRQQRIQAMPLNEDRDDRSSGFCSSLRVPPALVRLSAVLLVGSFFVMVSTSMLSGHQVSKDVGNTNDNDNQAISTKAATIMNIIFKPKKIHEHVIQGNYQLEESEGPKFKEALVVVAGHDEISEQQDDYGFVPSHHRRLKRQADNPKNNLDVKVARKKARAKANGVDSEKAVPALPPLLHLENRPAHLLFANQEAEDRYHNASKFFIDVEMRKQLDPLRRIQIEPIQQGQNAMQTVPFHPQVQYLGVLVDAGRHYFPIDWLKQLIIYLHKLRFNTVHFRLTDDQNFNLQLESYPELAFLSSPAESARRQGKVELGNDDAVQRHHGGTSSQTKKQNNPHKHHTQKEIINSTETYPKVYTPSELRELVAFAKSYNITIYPELNVPGHGGAWAGIPGLILNCAEFVCNRGYGIPLNIEHPQLKTILRGVIQEVLDIFDNPPFLHLGGDEISMSTKCFEELEMQPFNYSSFEQQLRDIVVNDIGYPEEQILRWEETDPTDAGSIYGLTVASTQSKSPRTGKVEHYWQSLPGSRKNPYTKAELEPIPPLDAVFVSRGLYMDVNHEDGAFEIFSKTIENFQIEKGRAFYPLGIIAVAFELSSDYWMQRNVAARLIAVAMGAARLKFNTTEEFWQVYHSTCIETLDLDSAVCDLQGYVAVGKPRYHRQWKKTWTDWTDSICNRLTFPMQKLRFKNKDSNRKNAFDSSNQYFWSTLKQPLKTMPLPTRMQKNSNNKSDSKRAVILDLVNGMHSLNETADLIKDYIAPIGIDLVQLRLVDNNAFAIQLEHETVKSFSPIASLKSPVPKAAEIATVVYTAQELGIEVFPEISLTTDTGGWLEGGFLVDCPKVLCGSNKNQSVVANDIGRKDFLPVVYAVLRELKEIFGSSRFLHLGSDERSSSMGCFQEAGYSESPSFSAFEKNLKKIATDLLSLQMQDIIRWENKENVRYPDRVGAITHYRATNPFMLPNVRMGEPFFVTIDILSPLPQKDGHQSAFYLIYKQTRKLAKLVPIRIFAELRILSKATWVEQFVGLRLVSFSIGTNQDISDDDYTKEIFVEILTKECQQAKLNLCTIEPTSSPQKTNQVYYVESDYMRNRICERNIFIETKRKPKPEPTFNEGAKEAS